MKKLLSILTLVAAFVAIVSLYSCGEDEPTKAPVAPTLTTSEVTGVSPTGATSGGNITSDGNAAVTARGVCWSTTPSPTTNDSKTDEGAGAGEFASTISGLDPGVTYYVRAYATNSVGTAYGNERSFSSSAILATVTTSVSDPTFNGATVGGEVTSDGGAQITERGICWSTAADPTVADNKVVDATAETGGFVSVFNGLEIATTYHIRAYAINSAGTSYGDDQTITTTDYASDVDGNNYKVVKIGNQIWMAENLKTTKYNNGEVISTDDVAVYDNDNTNLDPYGRLYTWTAVSDSRGVCPTGMHLPDLNEWLELMNVSGGYSIAGAKLKESGNSHWTSGASTDEYGFGALPGGKIVNSISSEIGTSGYYWSWDPDSPEIGRFSQFQLSDGLWESVGIDMYSVRCIVD